MGGRTLSDRWRRSLAFLRSARLAGGGAVILFCLVAILFLGFDVRTRLNALERANSDNSQWVMMQTEVEVLRLQVAVEHALNPTSDADLVKTLEEIRRWFNVLYSRVSMLEESAIYRPLLTGTEYSADHTQLRIFLDRTVPLIDGPDEGLQAQLPKLQADLPAVRAAARSLTLNSLSDFAAESDLQRTSIAQTLVRLAVLTSTLVLVLAGLALGMGRLYRTSETQAERLRQTGGRLSTIIANSADGIVVTDPDGIIEEFNPAAQAIFGLTRDGVLGRNALDLFFVDGPDGEQPAELIRALDSGFSDKGTPFRIEIDALRADGTTFPAEVSIATTRPSNRSLIVAFVRDISNRRKAQAELETALDRAVSGEKAKAEFLAVMSHEMRTPLNGLIGSMVLMGDTALDDNQRELLRVMQSSGDILLGHVNSVLDISRAEAGVIRVQETRFDLDTLIDETVANQAGLAQVGGNRIEVVALSGPIGRVSGDRGRIRQILLNLLGNAVKFTKDGTITIETERLPAPDGRGDGGEVEFRVIDTGIGISEADLVRIFDDFVTVDTSYGRTTNGTGLGLGIARRLAEAMGGEMGAESVEGEGSLFWVRLPLPPAGTGAADTAIGSGAADEADMPAEEEDIPDIPPLSVLVVEDNEINRFLLRRYLESANHIVTEAVDGIDGVATAETRAFDVILMDISMPRMDGIAATRTIRAGSGASRQTRILALTAHALPEEQARFREAGMESCLTKPIARGELLRALAGQLPTGARDQTATPPLVDQASLKELVNQIGGGLAAQLLRRLIEEGERTVGDSVSLMQAGDHHQVGRLCHQLAGTCGTFGTRRLRVLLADIETSVGRGDEGELRSLMEALPPLWTETRAVLADAAEALERAA